MTTDIECPTEPRASTSHVAHHFETAKQQFNAGKLGMWLFLVTEVLFFSGLFVAYAVYRVNHPEVFLEAHRFLNTTLGAANTIVLLLSSFTMAWSVRCAQLGQHRKLSILLTVTLACASLFLGVKAVEYAHKWGEGLLWAGAYRDAEITTTEVSLRTTRALQSLALPGVVGFPLGLSAYAVLRWRGSRASAIVFAVVAICSLVFLVGMAGGEWIEHLTSHGAGDIKQVGSTPRMELPQSVLETPNAQHSSMGVFFSIYYAMTGIHALHILVGIGVIAWLLKRSLAGEFNASYFAPVDYVGLYWHVVDLVWIYLFPLLYLIR